MILVPRAVRVYFATQPTSLRMSFDGLVNEIRHTLGHDPLAGVDPIEYLADVLPRLTRRIRLIDLPALLPARWAAARAANVA